MFERAKAVYRNFLGKGFGAERERTKRAKPRGTSVGW